MQDSKVKPKSLKVNALLNGIKQGCTVIFPLITFSYVTRALGNSEYGAYNFALSIINYFLLIAGLGINTYSVREGARIRDERKKISKFCSDIFTINVYSTIIAYAFLLLVTTLVPKIHSYSIQIYILSLGILFTTIGMDWINTIYEDYLYITIRYIIVQIVTLILTIIFVRSNQDLNKYCVISLFALYGGYLFNVFYVRRYARVKFLWHINLKHLRPLLVLFANSVATIIYVNSDITMLGFYKSNMDIGLYSFSSRIYNSAKQMLNAFVLVTIPRLASVVSSDDHDYILYLRKITSGICLVLFPVAIAIFSYRKEIILIMGGTGYIDSSTSLAILSFAIIFAILSSVVGNGILIVNRLENKCLLSTSVSAAVNVGVNFITLPIMGINGAAFTTLLAEAINFFIQLYCANKVVSWKKIVSFDLAIYCIEGIFIFLISIIIHTFFDTYSSILIALMSIIVSAVIAIAIYIALLLITHNKILKSASEIIHIRK